MTNASQEQQFSKILDRYFYGGDVSQEGQDSLKTCSAELDVLFMSTMPGASVSEETWEGKLSEVEMHLRSLPLGVDKCRKLAVLEKSKKLGLKRSFSEALEQLDSICHARHRM